MKGWGIINNQNLLWTSSFKADILSPHFKDSLKITKTTLPQIGENIYYNLIVEFPIRALNRHEQISELPTSATPYKSHSTPRQKITAILSIQLRNLAQQFIDLGYQINYAYIQGVCLEQNDIVVLKLLSGEEKEYGKNGKLKKKLLVCSIIPSALYTKDRLETVLRDFCVDSIQKTEIAPQ